MARRCGAPSVVERAHIRLNGVRSPAMSTFIGISDPASWHRRLCIVNDWLGLCGDLPTIGRGDETDALRQLEQWIDAGITDIIDVRGEYSDEPFVAKHAPNIRYHHLGTHDNGGSQSDAWFGEGLAAIAGVRAKGGRAVVHCHMGVNRAPSLAFRMLIEHGMDPVEALDSIRRSRPIAGIIYAPSAIDHYLRSIDAGPSISGLYTAMVRNWLDDNEIDLRWVISRIRLSE